MNFLKVKKFMFVFLFSFFISCSFVSAKTLNGDVYLTNDGRGEYSNNINLFEDTSNYNGFIEFLYNHNNDLVDYLFSYYGIDSSFYNLDYGLSIMTPDDIFWSKDTCVQMNASTECSDLEFNEFFSNNDYSISSTTIYKYYNNTMDINDVDYIVFYNRVTSADITSSNFELVIQPKIAFLFNSSGLPVGYFLIGNTPGISNSNNNSSSVYSFHFNYGFTSENRDMTSWFAYLYKLSSIGGLTSSYDTVYAFKFFNEGYSFLVNDNAGYSGIQKWVDGLFYANVDMSIWNLNFIYEDVFYKKGFSFVSLYDYWHVDRSDVVPDNFSSIDVSDNEKGYYLTPKSGCSFNDYIFYYTTETSVSAFGMFFGYYYLEDNVLKNTANLKVYSSKAYAFYSYQPLNDINVDVNDFLNYTINVSLNSSRHFYNLYYNPSCYFVDKAGTSDIVLEFDKGDYILSSTGIKDNFDNFTPNGNYSSDVSFGSSSSTSNNSNVNLPNVDDVVKNIPNYVSGFIVSIGALINVAYAFLFGLPSEIFGFLFSIFIVGMVIIVIKLVRGG